MHPGLGAERSLDCGCVRRITLLTRSWERRSLIAASGKKGGELGGEMGDVIDVRYWSKAWQKLANSITGVIGTLHMV